MATVQQLIDQLDSLVNSNQDRCRSDAHLDHEWQRYSMTYPDNIGYIDPQLQHQYDPYVFQQHQYQPYYPEPLNIYPHSSYPVHEPQPYESSDLRDMPIAYLSSNATLSPSYDPLEHLLKEQYDMLRRCTDKLSTIETLVQVRSERTRDQVITNNRLQEDERHPHTTSTSLDTDFHSHMSGCKLPSNPIQSSKSSFPPILNLSTSETDKEFILEELSEPLQLETTGQGDEYDEVDEEIELENPEVEIYTEDSASEGSEECTPTLRSDFILIQTDVVDTIPQQVVIDDLSHISLDESPIDLVEPSITIETITQVVDENVVTRLETITDTVPPPCPEYNMIINPKTNYGDFIYKMEMA